VKPSNREVNQLELLSGSFIAVPTALFTRYQDLGLQADELVILLQILAASQGRGTTELSAQEIGTLCKMTVPEVMERVDQLIRKSFLAIGERWNQEGTKSLYFDLGPLWQQLRGKDTNAERGRAWSRDPISLFEEEFGRPLSGLECEQIRQWMELDGHPDWMLIEALREAVLANKYSFKYIDRILFDWQRNRIRTRQELEEYRQSYRDRMKTREETAASQPSRQNKPRSSASRGAKNDSSGKDNRYSAFYELFPDS
jgi:DNA replication protein